MRRLRVQLTVLLALLGLLVVAWGAAIFLAARDAARSNASLQTTVERVDELRRSATRLSRDFVTMETTRRAYLLTGDEAAREAGSRAETSALQGFERIRQLSDRWRSLPPLVEGWRPSTGPGCGPGRPSWRRGRSTPARPPWWPPAATPTGTSRSCGGARPTSRTSWPGPRGRMPAARTAPTRPPRPWPSAPP
jgi:hypothetical protein